MAVDEVIAIFEAQVKGAEELNDLDDTIDKVGETALSLMDILKKFAAGAALAGTALKIKSFADETASAGDAIGDLSAKLGVSIEDLQAFNYAAELNASSSQGMSMGLMQLSKQVRAAQQGTSPAAQGFKKLGVSIKDDQGNLRGYSEILQDVATGLQQVQNPTEKVALAQMVLGETGSDLIPTMDNLQASMKEFKESEGGFTEEGIAAGGAYNDTMFKLDHTITRLKNNIMIALGPALSWIADKIAQATRWINKMTAGTHVMELGVGALGAALVVLSGIFIGSVLPAMMPIILLFAKWTLAVLVVILVLDDLWNWWEGKPSAFGKIIDKMFGEGSSEKLRTWVHKFAAESKLALSSMLDVLQIMVLSMADLGAALLQGLFILSATVSNSIKGIWNGMLVVILTAIEAAQKAIAKFKGEEFQPGFISNELEAAKRNMESAKQSQAGLLDNLPMQQFREDLKKTFEATKQDFVKNAMQTGSAGERAVQDMRQQTVNVTVQGSSDPVATGNKTAAAVSKTLDTMSMIGGVPRGK